MNATDITGFVTTLVGDIGDVLTGSVPVVLGLMGALIGLGFIIRFVKRNIGKKA